MFCFFMLNIKREHDLSSHQLYISHYNLVDWHSSFMCQSHTLDRSSLPRSKLISGGLIHFTLNLEGSKLNLDGDEFTKQCNIA